MDTTPAPPAAPKTADTATWTAFLTIAFAVVGLVGAFSTFAAQIPFDRAMARSQALDQAVAASHRPGASAALDELRPLLGDSADHVLTGPGTIEDRVAAERSRMLARSLHTESMDYGLRLRVVIAAFTAAAALFGAMVLSIVRKGSKAFFSEEKKQKTSVSAVADRSTGVYISDKSFLILFFQK